MDLNYLLSLMGTGFFAITGALSAIRHRMDVLGVVMIAFFVGLGGGTIRALCLSTKPVWLQDVSYIWAAVVPAVITFFIAWHFEQQGPKKPFSKTTMQVMHHFFMVFDAFGLGLFAITGTQIALAADITTVGSILMGMVTAVGGGIIRDILCNEIPLIFQGEIYATAALIGAGIYTDLVRHYSAHFSELISIGIVIVIRLAAVYFNWNAPKV